MVTLHFDLEDMSKALIGIAGAGGLGSNVAAILVRSGIDSLVLADFDIVEKGNLNRQFYFDDQIGLPKVEALLENLSRIAPSVQIDANLTRVTPENAAQLFGRCDIVVEAFDDASQKEWFVEFMQSHFPQMPLICASGLSGTQVQRSGNLYVVGDQRTETFAADAANIHAGSVEIDASFSAADASASVSTYDIAPRVAIIAAFQAETALNILKEKDLL